MIDYFQYLLIRLVTVKERQVKGPYQPWEPLNLLEELSQTVVRQGYQYEHQRSITQQENRQRQSKQNVENLQISPNLVLTRVHFYSFRNHAENWSES